MTKPVKFTDGPALAKEPLQMIIMQGIPGSGKTTAAESMLQQLNESFMQEPSGAHLQRPWVIVSRDALRKAMYQSIFDRRLIDENLIRASSRALIRNSLWAGHSVIVDDTNLHMRSIEELYKIASQCGAEPFIKRIDPTFSIAYGRNAERQFPVPDDIMVSMAQDLEAIKHIMSLDARFKLL